MMEADPDRACFDALARGETRAAEALHARHAGALMTYAQAILGRRDLAEEALQEVFAEMLTHPNRFAEARNPKGYLFGALRLSALGVRRRQRRWWAFAAPLPEKPWLIPAADATAPPGDLEALAEALSRLPEPEREAVVLKVYGDLTFAQMGEASGIPPKTMETRYYAALGKLRRRLADA